MRVQDRMTTAEVSEYIGIPAATIAGWRHRGVEVPWFKIGGSVFYWRADVDRWLADQEAA